MDTVDAIVGDDNINLIERLLRKHGGDLYGDLWKVGINVALRISDLLAIRFEDLRERSDGYLELDMIEGKTKKRRTVAFNKAASEVVRRRRDAHPGHIFLFEVETNRAKGRAISRTSVARKFNEVGDIFSRLTGDHVSLGTHSMRKTRGRAMWAAGVPIEMIAKVLNHSSPAVTMTYLGITAKEIDDTYLLYEL